MSSSRPDRLGAPKVVSHLGVMLIVAAVLGVVVSGLAIPFAGVLGFAARNVSESIDDLPQELETEQLPQRTTILDKAGNTIATVYDQNRINVDLVNISRIMTKAIVSIEDYRFYEHGALDIKGTLRALFTNQAANGVVQGGSSITQQLVKLTLQNQALLAGDEEAEEAATDDTYARKLRELRYAIALEKEHSKDWILERYLNTAYFGDSAHGIQAAAQHYFGVNAKELDLQQSALLAGLVQSPEAFNPVENPRAARERRDIVLDRMAELSVITDAKAEEIKKQGLQLDPQPMTNGCVSSRAPFFCDYVIAYLKQDPDLGRTPAERLRLVRSGGLTITTTIDTRMQDSAQRAVSANVYAKEGAIGALALVQPGTGEVKAVAQSRPMGADTSAGQTYLNYTVPPSLGNARGFQSGSTFKPFVLASAIDQGIPLTWTKSVPGTLNIAENRFKTCDGYYQSSSVWDVSNYDFSAHTVNLYSGTQLSVNTFFALLEERTGICAPWKLANDLGLNLSTDWIRPSFVLGIADVSPLAMAEAYATFAARGQHCESRPVVKIEDADGNVLKEYDSRCTQVLPGPVADAVNDVLQGVIDPGGFADAWHPGQDAAGKTGTTSDNTAVWFTGYTPNLAGAAMVAGVNEAGEPESIEGKVIGGYARYGTSGSGTAAPIWGTAFREIAAYLEDESFVQPDSADIAGVLIEVPYVAPCSSVSGAEATLEGAGFSAVTGPYVNSGCPRGTVAYTSHGAGETLGSGDTVTIYVSDGSPARPPKKDNKGDRGGNGGNNGNGNGNGGRGND